MISIRFWGLIYLGTTLKEFLLIILYVCLRRTDILEEIIRFRYLIWKDFDTLLKCFALFKDKIFTFEIWGWVWNIEQTLKIKSDVTSFKRKKKRVMLYNFVKDLNISLNYLKSTFLFFQEAFLQNPRFLYSWKSSSYEII